MAITNDNLWSDEEIAGDDGQGDEKLQAVVEAMRAKGVKLPDVSTGDELVDALHELLIAAKGGDDEGDTEEPKPYLMSTGGKQETGAEYLLRVSDLAPAPTIDQQQAEWDRKHRHPQ